MQRGMRQVQKKNPAHVFPQGRGWGLTKYLRSTIKYWPLTHIASGREATKLIINKKNPPCMCVGGCCIVFAQLWRLHVIPIATGPLFELWPPPLPSLSPRCRLSHGAMEKAISTRNPSCEQWLTVAGAGAGLSFRWWLRSTLVSH